LNPFNFALWGILGFILAVAGPFGTYETVDFGWRLLYWLCVVTISAILGYQCADIGRYLTNGKHPLISDLVSLAFLVVIFTPINFLLILLILAPQSHATPGVLQLAGYVAAIGFGILTGRRLVPGMEQENYLPNTHDSNLPRLMRRLPTSVQAPVLRISSQDHFVDVVTDRGFNRLRMRLADAVDEMDGVAGYVTHRSHWVAKTAIRDVERDNGRIQLLLRNGDSVPVSRTHKPTLEKAGLL